MVDKIVRVLEALLNWIVAVNEEEKLDAYFELEDAVEMLKEE